MNNEFILKKKTYNLFDYVRIPLAICPGHTIAEIINKSLSAVIPSIQVLVTARFINTALDVFNGKSQRSSIYLPLILLILLMAYGYLNWSLMSLINLKRDVRLKKVFQYAILEKKAKLKYCHIENNDTWNLISRTCNESSDTILKGFYSVIESIVLTVQIISLLLIILANVWWVAVIILVICIPLFFLAIKAGMNTYEAKKEAEKHMRRANYFQGVLDGRDNVEERTLFGYADSVNKQWYDKYEIARNINQKVELKNFIRMKGSSIITVFISILIIGMLLIPVSSGTITIGIFMALVPAILNLTQTMSWQLTGTIRQLSKNAEYMKDFTAFCALTEQEGALDLPDLLENNEFTELEFKNVSFCYPDTEKYILKNFSLKLKKNLHYAFVGINGAGKTTITKLLTGMYDNYEGEILINQKNIREYSQAQLKGLFSVVYQDFAKYYIPMKNNIALGNVRVMDDAAIIDAASMIGLDDLIDNLPEKIDTWLGKVKEDGTDLSGGEWQRVAIARALYNPAPVRILDEPTAALDPVAESNIYEMFGQISAGKSIIFITHRLGTAKLADEIIVIDGGRVKEKGSHQKLLEMNGIYAEMFEAQRSWYQ